MTTINDIYVLTKESIEEQKLKKSITEYKELYGNFKNDCLNREIKRIINNENDERINYYLIKDYISHRYDTKYNLISLTDINLFKYIQESLELQNFEEIEEDVQLNEIIKNHLINSYIANVDNKLSITKDRYSIIINILNAYNQFREQKQIKKHNYSKIKV